MQSQTATQEDIASAIEPCPPPVVSVTVVGELTISVEFADGMKGTVSFAPSHLTGVLSALREPDFFARVAVSNGAVTWPGEIDLAPDAMYDELSKAGHWSLE